MTKSPSPEIHNTAFSVLGLDDCRYLRSDHEEIGGVLEVLQQPTCRGGSVTIPHKTDILPHMAKLSDAATKIGAVNTVTKEDDGTFSGDNTDWQGIKIRLEALENAPKTGSVILLCGAGGLPPVTTFESAQLNH